MSTEFWIMFFINFVLACVIAYMVAIVRLPPDDRD